MPAPIALQLDGLEPAGPDPVSVAYGVGLDSTAMLVGLHARGERPDLILFADPGGEWPETYQYLERVARPWLRSIGFPDVVTVRYEPKTAPYTTLKGNCLASGSGTLPSLAFGRKSCSAKHKVTPPKEYRCLTKVDIFYAADLCRAPQTHCAPAAMM